MDDLTRPRLAAERRDGRRREPLEMADDAAHEAVGRGPASGGYVSVDRPDVAERRVSGNQRSRRETPQSRPDLGEPDARLVRRRAPPDLGPVFVGRTIRAVRPILRIAVQAVQQCGGLLLAFLGPAVDAVEHGAEGRDQHGGRLARAARAGHGGTAPSGLAAP